MWISPHQLTTSFHKKANLNTAHFYTSAVLKGTSHKHNAYSAVCAVPWEADNYIHVCIYACICAPQYLSG